MSKILVESNIGYNFLGIKYNLGPYREVIGMRGVSHLMEHLIIKSFKHKIEELRSLGISWNAYTADDHILIYFMGLEKSLNKVGKEIFEYIIGSNCWTEEEFNNEKLTVLQEYEDCFNDPISGVIENISRRFYNYYNPIGDRKDIENFTFDQSILFRYSFSKPAEIIEVGKNSIIDFNDFNNEEVNILKFNFKDYGTDHLDAVPKENKSIVGFIGKDVLPKDIKNKLGLILNMLTGDLDTPFYKEIRENRGLSYFSSGYLGRISDDIVPVFFSCTTNDNVAQLKSVYDELFSRGFENLITKENYNASINRIILSKEKDLILPHDGVLNIHLYKSYDGIDDFSYEEAIALAKNHLDINKLQYIQE